MMSKGDAARQVCRSAAARRWWQALLGALLGVCNTQQAGASDAASAVVPPPAHHTSQGFRNLYGAPEQHKGLWPYLRMKYFEERFPVPSETGPTPAQAVNAQALARPQADLQVTWLGHATALVQSQGVNLLTDPVFGERASPVPWAGPRRYSAPALTLKQLPRIDFVLISHNHYDHLERATVEQLGDSVQWLVPLGLKAWFASLGVQRVVELDWWQEVVIAGLRFTFTPTQHWSRRGLGDTNQTLWGSWAVEHGGQRFWFGGDTGYAQPLFQEIGRRLGPFDLALIPIGGYGPRSFMQDKHVDPDDAVRMHLDLRARQSVGIHWGTFVLTSEPIDEPPRLLGQARVRYGVPEAAFQALPLGRTLTLEPDAQQHLAKRRLKTP